MSDWKIPLSDLDYGPEEEAAVLRVLKSKWLSMGPEVQAFEREFAAMQGAGHAFAVANATAGLHLALLSLGLGPGDEIIQPALNFVAAANMTVAVGATPVFADILDLSEPTLDPAHVERLITPRTKAVVVMHYGGNLCRMAEFTELCKGHGLALIEDACHAVGAAYHHPEQHQPHGLMAGSMGDISAFSFFANKNLAMGEGGMVVTNRDDLADRLRLLRSHGMTTLTWDRHKGHASSYDVATSGYNYRLDEIHAALGRSQLAKLAGNNERRRLLWRRYAERMHGNSGIRVPFANTSADGAAHIMAVLLPTPDHRMHAMVALRAERIQTSLHYPAITDFSGFTTYGTSSVPHTREFAGRTLTLPLYPTMDEHMVDHVCEVLLAHAETGMQQAGTP